MSTAPESLEQFNRDAQKRGSFTAVIVLVANDGAIRIWAANETRSGLCFGEFLDGIAKHCAEQAEFYRPQGRA